MAEPADRHPPLCRAPEASDQVAAVLALMRRETGQARTSLVAHSWGSMPAARAAIAEPDGVDRLVLFAPIARRNTGVAPAAAGLERRHHRAQHARFVADVPKATRPCCRLRSLGPPGGSDPEAASARHPPCASPGPRADNAEAWSGWLAEPGRTHAASTVRGAWDRFAPAPAG
jgi:pimeloyl-ACP methyl ester carboxylesterase